MKKYLVVGLGNVGQEYANTRHNIGFRILDFFARQEGVSFEGKRFGDVALHKIKGRQILLLKPNTYMNLSGKAIRFWMQAEKIAAENVLVITDDINLPFGSIRLKGKGSDGGHNGLKSIQAELQSTDYPRFRFGVGADFSKGRQVDYVLGEWNEDEERLMPDRLEKSSELIKSFVLSGLPNTMNTYNGK